MLEQPIQQKSKRTTEQEYLRMEEASDIKHEFRDGEIIDMSGGTFSHAGIAVNLIGEIRDKLKGKSCRAMGSDLRVLVNKSGNYVYPDVIIICGLPEFAHPDRQTTITNPQVVFEVTSPSSETDDRGDKFNDYRRIESLQEYVLVSQDRAQVETFYRQNDGIWAIGPTVMGLDQMVKLRSVEIELSLKEIFAGIEFPAVSAPKAKVD